MERKRDGGKERWRDGDIKRCRDGVNERKRGREIKGKIEKVSDR
jgi:hypothetical protein